MESQRARSTNPASRVTSEDSSLRARSAKITATVIGISAVCVIALALTFWQDILVGYHVYRLRDDSGYLKEIATVPENSPQRLALTKYLETDDGKQQLFEMYREINELFVSHVDGLTLYPKRGVLAVHSDGNVVVYIRPEGGRNGVLVAEGTNESIQPLLPYLVGDSYNHENLRFSFQDSQSAKAEVGMERFDFPERSVGVIIRRTTDRN